MFRYPLTLLSLILFAGLPANSSGAAEPEGPPSMPIAFSVKRYGAAGDGKVKDTGAIQRAIDTASAGGGGTVIIPAGTYLTGTIFLKSKITLQIAAGATLLGSTDLAAVMLTGELWFRVPETIKFVYYGKLKRWVEGKDLILSTIGDIGVDGALYQAMEFGGEVIEQLPMAGRFTICNMAVEAGAKSGIIAPDKITGEYLQGRVDQPYEQLYSDNNATYREIKEYDVSRIEPQVAFPHLPENARGISKVGDVPIDQVVIGSCTNGRLEDLRVAAGILKGKRVSNGIRLIVIPATPQIYQQALKEGLFEVFLNAGAVISPPTCGPCLGGHMGVLAKGERAVATTNRNFVGRMGHPESEVYLANPAVAAASAVLGRIGSPEEIQ